MNKPDPVVHFEMPANDRQRMATFYNTAFGWQSQMMGPEMGDYVVVTTTEMRENGRPKDPGAINGGFFPRKAETNQHPSLVIAVDNINEAMQKVKSAGGNILGEPVQIPGVGSYVSFTDTEGNQMSILQPLMKDCQDDDARV
jgi:uncharacterized protein